jgi:glucokinase
MKPVVGIDLGGTRLRVAVSCEPGKLDVVVRRPTQAEEGPERVLRRIVDTVAQALEQASLAPAAVGALAIAAPGPLNPRAGVIYYAVNLPGWHDVPLAEILSRETGIRSVVHHDAHLAALGENRRGAATDAKDVAYVTISTGVGAGLILDGSLYSGFSGTAGEVGHIVVEPGGPLCKCGNQGCLEAVASGTAIAREAKESIARGVQTSLSSIDEPTAKDVSAAARSGDSFAISLLEHAGSAIGLGMGTVINLLNPQVLVLGGSVMKAGPLIWRPIRAAIPRASLEAARRGMRIVSPALGQDAGLIGAVEWARDCLTA